jgi:hypothetical protein
MKQNTEKEPGKKSHHNYCHLISTMVSKIYVTEKIVSSTRGKPDIHTEKTKTHTLNWYKNQFKLEQRL